MEFQRGGIAVRPHYQEWIDSYVLRVVSSKLVKTGVEVVDWQFQADQASLEAENWRVELDPRAPNHGMKLQFGTVDFGSFFKINPRPSHSFSIQEAYVREEDLILRYEQSGEDLYTVQLNWRRLESEVRDSLCIELWLSVQTSLLDTHPVIDVRSRTPDALWHILTLDDLSLGKSDAAAMGLVKKSGVTAMIMIEPMDARQAQKTLDRNDYFNLKLFGEFMEKGVIRRTRLRFLAVTGELARSKIAKQYRIFTDSPLPLTA